MRVCGGGETVAGARSESLAGGACRAESGRARRRVRACINKRAQVAEGEGACAAAGDDIDKAVPLVRERKGGSRHATEVGRMGQKAEGEGL
jgi:hypothetical protein